MNIKKIISAVIALNMVFAAARIPVSDSSFLTISASQTESDPDSGYVYDVFDDHTEITGYKGSADTLSIPSVIAGLPVTKIERCAFSNNSEIKSVIIPDSVKYIGDSAFSECTSLKDIMIPDSVTSIESDAFYRCSALENITLPDTLEYIGYSAFDFTAWFDRQPEGPVYAGNLVYSYKKPAQSTAEFTIKEGTTGFSEIFNYTNRDSFSDITTVNIPASLKSLPSTFGYLFKDVSKFNVSDENSCFTSTGSVLFSKDMTELIVYSSSNKNTSYTVPEQTVIIGGYAFQGCDSLTDINLSDRIEKIGRNAFGSCTKLRNIELPDTVKTIGEYAFYSDPISNIILPSSLETIGKYAFSSTSLREITLPESVTAIGYASFANCSSLGSVTILNPDCSMNIDSSFMSNYTISNRCVTTPEPEGVYVSYNPYYNGIKDPDWHFDGIIYGYADSVARKYAEYCGYTFAEISDKSNSKNAGYGDMDLNGTIDMSDLTTLSLHLIGDCDMHPEALINADVTADGMVNLADLSMLKQYIMKEPVHLGLAEYFK
ncbi:MAG: leucine-rich repeat protein [Oscillospiraceae bacterium]|nr:leucine-rich repeat protein [Oscillospiraceae bacterium]